MENVTIEQAESSENTAIEGTSLIELNEQEPFERHDEPEVVQGSNVDPEVQPAVEDAKVTGAIEVNVPTEVEDQFMRNGQLLVDFEEKSDPNPMDANQQIDLNTVVNINSVGNINSLGNINSVANLSDEVVNTPPPSPVKSIADEASESEIEVTENSTMEGKSSSDDEEYSGCDIDMGGASSYREEVSVHKVVDSANYDVIKACDDENNPIFVDLKYSVGEQINVVAQDEYVLDIPSPSVVNSEEASAPWDSSGQFIENAGSAINESIPSNEADNSSRSSRSSISDANDDSETKAVAEQTVSNAIQAAYEIYAAKSDDHSDVDTDEVADTWSAQDQANAKAVAEQTVSNAIQAGYENYAAEHDEHPDSETNKVADTTKADNSTEVLEKCNEALDNTSEGIKAVESSSLSCTGNEGVETSSLNSAITTLHVANDHSQQETNADTDSTRDNTDENIEINSPAVINESQLNSDSSQVDSSPATKVSSQESDYIAQVIASTDTVDVIKTDEESVDTTEHDTSIVKEEQLNISTAMANEQEASTMR